GTRAADELEQETCAEQQAGHAEKQPHGSEEAQRAVDGEDPDDGGSGAPEILRSASNETRRAEAGVDPYPHGRQGDSIATRLNQVLEDITVPIVRAQPDGRAPVDGAGYR